MSHWDAACREALQDSTIKRRLYLIDIAHMPIETVSFVRALQPLALCTGGGNLHSSCVRVSIGLFCSFKRGLLINLEAHLGPLSLTSYDLSE